MYARDIAPSRLIRAKMAIKKVLGRLGGDRVALITFAGRAIRNSPLTKDYSSLEVFLDEVDPSQMPIQGTNINEAIELAGKTLNNTDKNSRFVVLISDGENHKEELDRSITLIKKMEIKLVVVGVGSRQGAPVPDESENGEKGSFKKDRGGNIILSKMNPVLLQNFSGEVKGEFIKGNNFDDLLPWSIEKLAKGKGSELGEGVKKYPKIPINFFFF